MRGRGSLILIFQYSLQTRFILMVHMGQRQHRGPIFRGDDAPAKVSPSNDRDGVKGPPQKCRPPKIGMGRRQHRRLEPWIKLAPAKVSPSNDRDGVKGPPQKCRPSKIGMGRRLNRALQISSLQADGTKAPRHGAGLCVALGISTRFNARDGETNVRPHPVSFHILLRPLRRMKQKRTTLEQASNKQKASRRKKLEGGDEMALRSNCSGSLHEINEREALSGRRQSDQGSARLSPVVEGEDAGGIDACPRTWSLPRQPAFLHSTPRFVGVLLRSQYETAGERDEYKGSPVVDNTTHSSNMSDTVKCANVQANGGSCTYPACNCAEPPKSK
ncbi:predicted protein [Postia placenta Mad-698-R]|nr:predicted protein [Postia placenta Mad-698-R]